MSNISYIFKQIQLFSDEITTEDMMYRQPFFIIQDHLKIQARMKNCFQIDFKENNLNNFTVFQSSKSKRALFSIFTLMLNTF